MWSGEGRTQFFFQSYDGRIEERRRARGKHEADKSGKKEEDKNDQSQESEFVLLKKPPELVPARLSGDEGFFNQVYRKALRFSFRHSRILGSTSI
jgi:hypothetical protein